MVVTQTRSPVSEAVRSARRGRAVQVQGVADAGAPVGQHDEFTVGDEPDVTDQRLVQDGQKASWSSQAAPPTTVRATASR